MNQRIDWVMAIVLTAWISGICGAFLVMVFTKNDYSPILLFIAMAWPAIFSKNEPRR
jgi:predicted membrane channel-forming protein YqfA (hemolysin III family)